MSKRYDGHTPKSYAISSAISEIHALYHLWKREPDRIEGTPAFQRAVMRQLAKLHNEMLDKSDLNGLHIEVEPTTQERREAEKRAAQRQADHVDGYDRDDLGESPDF